MGVDLSAFDVFYVLIRLYIVLVNIFGNSLILSAVRYSKHFTVVTCHLIGHFAVADLLYGCAFGVHAGLVLGQRMTYPACLAITLALVTSGMFSSYGICLVCLENYISIRSLITGSGSGSKMSLRCARIWISAGWAAMFIVTIVYLLNLPVFVPSDTCDIGGPQFCTPFLIFGWVLSFTLLLSMMILMTLMLVKIHTMLKTLFQAEDSAANHFKQRNAQKKSNLARLFAILCFGYMPSVGVL